MEKVTDYRSLSRLVMAQIRPGVLTNNFMDKNDYLSEIGNGSLYYQTWEGGLLLFRRRQGFTRLSYYLQDSALLPELLENEIFVTEPVFRPGDDGERISQFLEDLGFERLFRRIRLVRTAKTFVADDAEKESGIRQVWPSDMDGDGSSIQGTERDNAMCVRRAVREDVQSLYNLLLSCYDPQTACLPRKGEMEQKAADGNLICAVSENGETIGAFHFKPGKKSTELRHVAVSEPARGRGTAQRMIDLYLQLTEDKESLVWVREDNEPALRLYLHNGYRADGWSSAVLRRTAR